MVLDKRNNGSKMVDIHTQTGAQARTHTHTHKHIYRSHRIHRILYIYLYIVLFISNIHVRVRMCICAHTHIHLRPNSVKHPGHNTEIISLCFTQRQSLYKHIQEVIIIVMLFMEKCVAKM